MTTIVDVAMYVAMEAHGGDKNRHDGELYLKHLARVWVNIRDAGGDECQQAIAWLHDSIEDTPLDFHDLFSKLATGETPGSFINPDDIARVVKGVRGMTKIKGETNFEYYHRCRENEDSRFVKLRGDLVDNFRRNHQIKDEATRLRLTGKYSLGMDILS